MVQVFSSNQVYHEETIRLNKGKFPTFTVEHLFSIMFNTCVEYLYTTHNAESGIMSRFVLLQ